MTKKLKDEELDFVLQHYEEKRFSPDEAMNRIGVPARRIALRRIVAVAASLLCLVVMAAVASW